MSVFRKIEYQKLLYESLRSYFSINKSGRLSFLYKFLLACLWPLQQQWSNFEIWRQKIWLISQCEWQLGQLTNVLNMLYDPISKRIYILQAEGNYIFDPTFEYDPINFDPTFVVESTTYEPQFDDISLLRETIIFIPGSLSKISNPDAYSDMVSTIEKIRILGLSYIIEII